MPDLSLLSWTEISCCTRTNMSDALSDVGTDSDDFAHVMYLPTP